MSDYPSWQANDDQQQQKMYQQQPQPAQQPYMAQQLPPDQQNGAGNWQQQNWDPQHAAYYNQQQYGNAYDQNQYNYQEQQQQQQWQPWQHDQQQQQYQQQQQAWNPQQQQQPGQEAWMYQQNGEADPPGAAGGGGAAAAFEQPQAFQQQPADLSNTGTGAAAMQEISLNDSRNEDENKPMFASSSFGQLPEMPSEFDALGNNASAAAPQEPVSVNSGPKSGHGAGAAASGGSLSVVQQQQLQNHSRQSSGGNVQFIVGSGANSANQSATHSPQLFGDSSQKNKVEEESKGGVGGLGGGVVEEKEHAPPQQESHNAGYENGPQFQQHQQQQQQQQQPYQPSVAAAEIDRPLSVASNSSHHSHATDSMGAMGPGPIHYPKAPSEHGSESSEVAAITQRIAPANVDSGPQMHPFHLPPKQPSPPLQAIHEPAPPPAAGGGASAAMTGPPVQSTPPPSSLGLPPPLGAGAGGRASGDNPFRRGTPQRRYTPAQGPAAAGTAAMAGTAPLSQPTPDEAQPAQHAFGQVLQPTSTASPFQPLQKQGEVVATTATTSTTSNSEENTSLNTSHTSVTSSTSSTAQHKVVEYVEQDVYKQSLSYQKHQKHRADHNPSPAATLWNNPTPRSPLTLAPVDQGNVDPQLVHPQHAPVTIQPSFSQPAEEAVSQGSQGFSVPPGGPTPNVQEHPDANIPAHNPHDQMGGPVPDSQWNSPQRQHNQEANQYSPPMQETSPHNYSYAPPALNPSEAPNVQRSPSQASSPDQGPQSTPSVPQTPQQTHSRPGSVQSSGVPQSPPTMPQSPFTMPKSPNSPRTPSSNSRPGSVQSVSGGQYPFPNVPQTPPTMPQSPFTMPQSPNSPRTPSSNSRPGSVQSASGGQYPFPNVPQTPPSQSHTPPAMPQSPHSVAQSSPLAQSPLIQAQSPHPVSQSPPGEAHQSPQPVAPQSPPVAQSPPHLTQPSSAIAQSPPLVQSQAGSHDQSNVYTGQPHQGFGDQGNLQYAANPVPPVQHQPGPNSPPQGQWQPQSTAFQPDTAAQQVLQQEPRIVMPIQEQKLPRQETTPVSPEIGQVQQQQQQQSPPPPQYNQQQQQQYSSPVPQQQYNTSVKQPQFSPPGQQQMERPTEQQQQQPQQHEQQQGNQHQQPQQHNQPPQQQQQQQFSQPPQQQYNQPQQQQYPQHPQQQQYPQHPQQQQQQQNPQQPQQQHNPQQQQQQQQPPPQQQHFAQGDQSNVKPPETTSIPRENPPANEPITGKSRKESVDSIASEINPPPPPVAKMPNNNAWQEEQRSQAPPQQYPNQSTTQQQPSGQPSNDDSMHRQDSVSSMRSDQSSDSQRGYDPRSDPRHPQYDPKSDVRNPHYDPRADPKSQHYDPRYDNKQDDSRYDPKSQHYDSRYDANDPKYDPRYDSRSSQYDPRYDSRSSQYDPRYDPKSQYYDPRYDPRTDRRSQYYDARYDPHSRYYDARYAEADRYRGGSSRDYYSYDSYHQQQQHHHHRPSSRSYYDYDHYYSSSSGRPRSRAGVEEDYDRPRSRPTSRQGYPDDRPSSRQGQVAQPERPQSRQDTVSEHTSSRPSSRQGQPERPSSRSGYEGYRGREYRGKDYYDRDGQYRDYNYDEYSRSRYYDEYYRDADHYDMYHRERMDRAYQDEMRSYKQGEYDSSRYEGYEGRRSEYDDRSSQHSEHSQSRGTTPGVETGADQFAREFHQGSRPNSRMSGYEQSPIYPGDATGHGYYQQSYNDGASYVQPEPTPPARLTPVRYSMPHVRAAFGPGCQLVRMLPNNPADGQPAIVEMTDISEAMDASQFQQFPGPLVRGDTHKNDVLYYCQQMAQQCQDNMDMLDRESAVLVWKLLELLIKQNGAIIGTDISDLLLAGGHEPTWQDYSKGATPNAASTTVATTAAAAAVVSAGDDVAGDPDSTALTTTSDRVTFGSGGGIIGGKSMDEVTDRFRHLLLHGRKKDALEWAMKQNLWGHALFLASKMDPKTHASIMTRFANVSMKMNDPLQTLYQLMSGRQPAAVTLVADEKWGDWRPHLAIVLSNHSARPDLDYKSIVTLGDTLASKGYLHASHFCYMMAQLPFGSYDKKASKLVLIGSNHGLPFGEFASNVGIQCTEVYEYAMSLGNSTFHVPSLQLYKFLYATRLADVGMTEEALHYCETLSWRLVAAPGVYGATLLSNVLELAERLKYHDPQRLHAGDDAADPTWLAQLQTTVQAVRSGHIQPVVGIVDPNAHLSQYPEAEAAAVQQQQQYNQYPAAVPGDVMNQTGQYAQQQQQQQQQQPQQWDPAQQQQWQQQQQWNQSYYTDGSSYLDYNQQQQQLQQQQQQQQQQQVPHQQAVEAPVAPQDALQAAPGQTPAATAAAEDQIDSSGSYARQISNNENDAEETTDELGESQTSVKNEANFDYYGISTQQVSARHRRPSYPRDRRTSTGSQQHSTPRQRTTSTSSTTISPPLSPAGRRPSGHTLSPRKTPTAPGSFQFGVPPPIMSAGSNLPLGASASNFANGGGPSQGAPNNAAVDEQPKKKTVWPGEEDDAGQSSTTKKSNSKLDKGKANNGGGGGGWLGGLFSWRKNKNEMKLPDDKNPAIVWDKDAKKWVNVDGEEEDSKPPPPPPTDKDFGPPAGGVAPAVPGLPQTPQQQQPGGANSSSSSLQTSASTNRFSRTSKAKGARGQYVDVLGGSAAKPAPQAPANLFNVLPKSHSVPANIFVPGLVEGAVAHSTPSHPEAAAAEPQQQPQQHEEQPQQHQQQHQQQQQQQPQFFNPSQVAQQPQQHPQHPPPPQEHAQQQQLQEPKPETLSRSSSQSSLSREIQRYIPQEEAPPPPAAAAAPPPSMPMMFNPTQLPASSSSAAAPPRSGPRYGQRRAYPK